MPTHISTEEARKQGLVGSDSYLFTHLRYIDDLHRDSGVVRLNVEAMKAFSDTIIIARRHTIAAEQAAFKEWIAHGGSSSDSSFPRGRATYALLDFMNLEHLKIASAFELHLKARLLSRDFVIHEIDEKIEDYRWLANEQRGRPILKQEIFAIQSFHFNGAQNYIPGLKESSVKFFMLTDKKAYKAVLGLTDQQLGIIRDYRLLRNQIHLPGDIVETPSLKAYSTSIVEFLTEFINKELVTWSNNLILKHRINRQPLEILD